MPFSAPAARRPAARSSPLPSWAGLKAIADGQRSALVALLAGILAIPLAAMIAAGLVEAGMAAGGVVLLLTLGVRTWMALAVYRLARALGSRVGVLWALGAFLPNIVGLIVLAVISARATGRLKKAGLKVGLLGAKLAPQPPTGFPCQELEHTFG